ncbi:sigma-70 family RNA polymerase sigma factor [Maribellus comscasis]|uniref:Sigma-70 family RNA polymerase sigma factor n=1 Tax=Maribellus comscasis TaxID=2681766 RepID=A0A6I6K2H9_9BACT|nr:sigma-70 family RNA polymerase sigma factor [Maribellus comscasis]QGY46717.1 sigma-70 family RNA polymerase sigma factor [Maribellus comscasis]
MQLNPFRHKNKEKSEEELLADYLANKDMNVLGELYKRYMHLVYGVCLKYFKEREKSQDAVILIFEKLLIEIEKHKIRNFKSWLYVVAKNHCLMELRKTKAGKIISIADENEMAAFMEIEPELHPIDREADEINEQALNDCIERLKNEQKNCIRLFYYENKSYREICIILELEEKKVKSFIQNGKRNLKICLESKNAQE